MKKIWMGVLAALALTLGVVAPASAHHPVITGVADCDGYVDWTVTPDAQRGKQWKVTTASTQDGPVVDLQSGGWLDDDLAETGRSGPHTGEVTLTVKASWKGGPNNETRTGTVTIPTQGCEPEVPEQPAPLVETVTEEGLDCESSTITTLTTTTTTEYVLVDGAWVLGEPVVTQASSVRPAEPGDCETEPTPTPTEPEPTVTPEPEPTVTTPAPQPTSTQPAPRAQQRAEPVAELAYTGPVETSVGVALAVALMVVGAALVLLRRRGGAS